MKHAPKFKFRIYVADSTQNSEQAIVNLNAFCRDHLPGQFEIEVVDVFQDPKRALAEGIFLTPTLVKLSPPPMRKIVGTLSQVEPLLRALGLEPVPA
jgi:circadian clock protein KaiB